MDFEAILKLSHVFKPTGLGATQSQQFWLGFATDVRASRLVNSQNSAYTVSLTFSTSASCTAPARKLIEHRQLWLQATIPLLRPVGCITLQRGWLRSNTDHIEDWEKALELRARSILHSSLLAAVVR